VVARKGFAAWGFAWGTCRRRGTFGDSGGVGLGVGEQVVGGYALVAEAAVVFDGPSVADQPERLGLIQ
jgi:hypothetical protein